LKVVDFWGRSPHNSRKFEGNGVCAADVDKTHVIKDLDPGSLCPRLNFCPDTDCLCVPISTSGEMILGILSLCCDHRPSVDPDSDGNDRIETKRIVLTRVAEHYALALVNLRLRESLRMECIRDPLTGLYNRRYMEESLEREALRARRHNTSIGIIMLDIDHFKHFNDIFGHEAGDIVLKELGSFLRAHTRGEDIACRYGGDEFLVILPETSQEIVIQRAQELHIGVKKLKIVYRGRLLHITISAGVAVLPDQSSNVKDVVKAADSAMYQAKERGRDQVVVAD
jgi:diguanylate cyclase (GGDEF)-like protein